MLMNANTATRSFRELRFDLVAFLQAMCKIPTTTGVLEIKWSDGSVDIVPTYGLISELVGKCYEVLHVGDAVLSASSGSGEDYREKLTLLLRDASLCAKIAELGSPESNLEFVRGTIRRLVSDVVVLGPDVAVSDIHVDGMLHVEECTASWLNADFVETSIMYVQDSVDLSKTISSPAMQFLGGLKDISVCSNAPAVVTGELLGGYALTGYMRYSAVTLNSLQALFDSGNPQISVEVPVLSTDGQRTDDGFVYVVSSPEDMPTDMTKPFPASSLACLMLLYPKKALRSMGSVSDIYMRIVAPLAEDSDHIVQICNNSGMTLNACNAWRFSAVDDSSSGTRVGNVAPLSYVKLPPFSSVDFLFKYEIVGSRLCVYMLPMRTLD